MTEIRDVDAVPAKKKKPKKTKEARDSVLTDFSPDEYRSVDAAAARFGSAVSSWVSEAVELTYGRSASLAAGSRTEPAQVPDGKRIQVRVRLGAETMLWLAEYASATHGVGVSTIIREIALSAAGVGDKTTASKLSNLTASATRRARSIRVS